MTTTMMATRTRRISSSLLPLVQKHYSPRFILFKSRLFLRNNVVKKHFFSSNNDTTTLSSNDESIVSILIVGGGPTGLWLSTLLSMYGISSHRLLEASSSWKEQWQHPQAHFLNTRTMELLAFEADDPKLYTNCRMEMPPVHHYKSFLVCGIHLSNVLCHLHHPVHIPIRTNLCANGRLVSPSTHHNNNNNNMEKDNQEELDESTFLSPCTVGHLAQHTFSKLLYQAAIQAAQHHDMNNANENNENDRLCCNARVEDVEWVESKKMYKVITSSKQSNKRIYWSPIVVAADGAHSILRNKFWNISFLQEPPITNQSFFNANKNNNENATTLQHLVNIHVKVSSQQQHPPPAMLYYILHPKAIAMVVRHSATEFIVQIPYFPPYQTLEDDFSHDKVHNLMQDFFGQSNNNDDNDATNFQVVSIKTWEMKSAVAQSYHHHGGGGVLVGDAAHVFAPAGGFGMNTGLQDVYTLAWRLAYHCYNHDNQQHGNFNNNTNDGNDNTRRRHKHLNTILYQYQQERRPVAQQNASLSLRNYQRILNLTRRGCYLHHEHSQLLTQLLNHNNNNDNWLPLVMKQDIFKRLLELALWPLSFLNDLESRYTRLVISNLQKVFRQGGGLPLLFPKYELGFGYNNTTTTKTTNDDDNDHQNQDTWGYKPFIKEGHLFPHVNVQVLFCHSQHYNLLSSGNDESKTSTSIMISTSNLPAQIRPKPHGRPHFVMISIIDNNKSDGETFSSGSLDSITNRLAHQLNVALVHVQIISGDNNDKEKTDVLSETTTTTLLDRQGMLGQMLDEDKKQEPVVVLVRPDGHIAKIIHPSADHHSVEEEIRDSIIHLVPSAAPKRSSEK